MRKNNEGSGTTDTESVGKAGALLPDQWIIYSFVINKKQLGLCRDYIYIPKPGFLFLFPCKHVKILNIFETWSEKHNSFAPSLNDVMLTLIVNFKEQF